MKPAPFDYYAPSTIEEAVDLLGELGDDGKVLSGGQSLIPMLALRLARFGALIDIGRITELQRVERTDGHLSLGAAVCQGAVERDDVVRRNVALLWAAMPLIGHFQIRNRGTVGGSIAHADPAAECPAVALALDAEMDIAGPGGRRSVTADAFFTGMWETALEPGELLVGVRFPLWGDGCGFAVEEVARRHGDFAMAGCACAVRVDDGQVTRASIALFGVASTPVRAGAAEAALLGSPADAVEASEIGRLASVDLDPPSDLHASGALRRRLAASVVAQAVGRAVREAGDE